jgi:hypothetical protein
METFKMSPLQYISKRERAQLQKIFFANSTLCNARDTKKIEQVAASVLAMFSNGDI